MKKFLKKIVIYFISMITICYVVQYFVDNGLHKINVGRFGVWNKMFSGKINSDIIISGSSRARRQFDPKIIEDSTGLSCFNIGIDGGRIMAIKSRWDSYITNNQSPKILIQDFELWMFVLDSVITNREDYLPYLSETSISSNLEIVDSDILLGKNIPLYKYRGLHDLIVKGLMYNFTKIHETKDWYYNGYQPIDIFHTFQIMDRSLIFSKEELKEGRDFILLLNRECKNKGITLILVHAPLYFHLQDKIPQMNSGIARIKQLAIDYHFQFWDYSYDSLSFYVKYFYNSGHLNKLGSEIFTKHLASDLKRLIDDKKLSSHSHL